MSRSKRSSHTPKPRAKYVGPHTTHPLEHAEDVTDLEHEDDLIGTSASHGAASVDHDREPEEPSGETEGSTES